VSKSIVQTADRLVIKQAVDLLKAGQLVAFPTETVYGLGADAQNDSAIARLYQAKGRPQNHPVIVHLAGLEKVESWCLTIPKEAHLLAKKFWPGPLTLVLKRSTKAKDSITGSQDTVAIRIPNHPIALELLTAFGDGLVAPSANKHGNVSPTHAEHVVKEFGADIPLVLDGGPCQIGIESTVLDLSGEQPQILRPGMISPTQIAECLGLSDASSVMAGKSRVRAPGDLPRHYAPGTPLIVVTSDELKALIESGTKTYVIMSFEHLPESSSILRQVIASREPAEFARDLYSTLRMLDAFGADFLLVEAVPDTLAWTGVRDRLKRAAHK
jgi:L-threonylcarbamoyladenylate synthase